MGKFLTMQRARNTKPIAAEPGEFLTAGGARRLEAEQDADGLQNAGFALRIIPRE